MSYSSNFPTSGWVEATPHAQNQTTVLLPLSHSILPPNFLLSINRHLHVPRNPEKETSQSSQASLSMHLKSSSQLLNPFVATDTTSVLIPSIHHLDQWNHFVNGLLGPGCFAPPARCLTSHLVKAQHSSLLRSFQASIPSPVVLAILPNLSHLKMREIRLCAFIHISNKSVKVG